MGENETHVLVRSLLTHLELAYDNIDAVRRLDPALFQPKHEEMARSFTSDLVAILSLESRIIDGKRWVRLADK